jgi:hypothetical protein
MTTWSMTKSVPVGVNTTFVSIAGASTHSHIGMVMISSGGRVEPGACGGVNLSCGPFAVNRAAMPSSAAVSVVHVVGAGVGAALGGP